MMIIKKIKEIKKVGKKFLLRFLDRINKKTETIQKLTERVIGERETMKVTLMRIEDTVVRVDTLRKVRIVVVIVKKEITLRIETNTMVIEMVSTMTDRIIIEMVSTMIVRMVEKEETNMIDMMIETMTDMMREIMTDMRETIKEVINITSIIKVKTTIVIMPLLILSTTRTLKEKQ